MEVLLRKRADLRAQNKQGKTPVDVATGEAKALLEQKLAEAAAAPAAAEAPPFEADGGEAEAPSAEAAEQPTAEPAAGSKRGTTEIGPSEAKRPKVVLSFDAGEGEDD